MNVNLTALVIKRDLKILANLYNDLLVRLESIIEPLDNPFNIFSTDEYNELIFNHFPVEADLFGGSQNFYYNFYNFKFFIVNSSILIDNNVEFETISFDPITLVAVAKFKLLLKK